MFTSIFTAFTNILDEKSQASCLCEAATSTDLLKNSLLSRKLKFAFELKEISFSLIQITLIRFQRSLHKQFQTMQHFLER